MIDNCIDFILKQLYPPDCLLCGAPCEGSRPLCTSCLRDLPRNTACCRLCALPLPNAAAGSLCGACGDRRPALDRVIAPLLYTDPVDRLIGEFKFHGQLHVGRLLAQLLGDAIEAQASDRPEVIIPVPLHSSRLRRRGYNQALELARGLSRRFCIPLDYRAGRRILPTLPQAGLSGKTRRTNLRGAFSVREGLPYRHVAIVDDVVTTGSTLGELARALKQRGIIRIDAWALARTPGHRH